MQGTKRNNGGAEEPCTSVIFDPVQSWDMCHLGASCCDVCVWCRLVSPVPVCRSAATSMQAEQVPIPALLATGAVHHHLIRTGAQECTAANRRLGLS